MGQSGYLPVWPGGGIFFDGAAAAAAVISIFYLISGKKDCLVSPKMLHFSPEIKLTREKKRGIGKSTKSVLGLLLSKKLKGFI